MYVRAFAYTRRGGGRYMDTQNPQKKTSSKKNGILCDVNTKKNVSILTAG